MSARSSVDMKIAAVFSPRWPEYFDWLSREMSCRCQFSLLVASFDELNIPSGFPYEPIVLPVGSRLEFSGAIHQWLMKNSQHVVEAFSEGYPLLIENLAGGTPTVIRYEVAGLACDMRVSRQDLWTEKVLEEQAIRGACRVISSQPSLNSFVSKLGVESELLHMGVRFSPGSPKEVENRIVVISDDIDPELSSYLVASATVSWIDRNNKNRSPVESMLSLEENFSGAAGTIIECHRASYLNVAKSMFAGAPVILLGEYDHKWSGWPVCHAKNKADVKGALDSIRHSGEGLRKSSQEFAGHMHSSEMGPRQLDTYRKAFQSAVANNRIRGW